MCLSLVLIVATVSSVNVAIPSLAQSSLSPSDTQILWIVDAYALVFAALLLPAGAIGDRFGRKGALLVGLTIFAVASAMCAVMESPGALIGARAVMGIGAALIMPSTLSLLQSAFPPKERREGDRHLVRVRRRGWCDRTADGRLPAPALLVRLGVLRRCAHRRHRVHGERAARTEGEGGPRCRARPARRAALDRRLQLPCSTRSSRVPSSAGRIPPCSPGSWSRPSASSASSSTSASTAEPMLDLVYFRTPRFAMGSLGITFTFLAMFSMFFVLTQYLQYVQGYSPLAGGRARPAVRRNDDHRVATGRRSRGEVRRSTDGRIGHGPRARRAGDAVASRSTRPTGTSHSAS